MRRRGRRSAACPSIAHLAGTGQHADGLRVPLQTAGLGAQPSEPQPVIDALHYNGSPHGGPYTPELARQDGTKRDRGARGGTAVGQNGGISTARYTSSDYTDFV